MLNKVTILIIAFIFILIILCLGMPKKKEKEAQPVETQTKVINFDGTYKNEYGAIVEIKGNRALFYASKPDKKNNAFIEDNFISSCLAGDGQTKTLRYRYIDDTGGYTILIMSNKLLITYEKETENNLIANQYNKMLK